MSEEGDKLMKAQRAHRQRRKDARVMRPCEICGLWPDKGHAPHCANRTQGAKGATP